MGTEAQGDSSDYLRDLNQAGGWEERSAREEYGAGYS